MIRKGQNFLVFFREDKEPAGTFSLYPCLLANSSLGMKTSTAILTVSFPIKFAKYS